MLGIHGIHRETKKGNSKNACVRDYISFNLIEKQLLPQVVVMMMGRFFLLLVECFSFRLFHGKKIIRTIGSESFTGESVCKFDERMVEEDRISVLYIRRYLFSPTF